MFVLKNKEELEKLTQEEQVAYAVEKANFEQKERERLGTEITELKSKFNEFNSGEKEQLDAQKTQIDDLTKQLSKFVEIETKLSNIDKSIEDLGKKDVETKTKTMKDNSIIKQILDLTTYQEGEETKIKAERIDRTTLKVQPQEVMSVANVVNGNYPAPGTTGLPASFIDIYRQYMGIYSSPRPISPILEFIRVSPLVNDGLICFETKINGGFQVTPECTVKPFIYANLQDQKDDAETIAGEWCTTTKLRTFYSSYTQQIENEMYALLNEQIPLYFQSKVVANGVPFVPLPNSAQNTAPDRYEAIIKVAASLKKQGFMPSVCFVSNIDYANMLTELGTDGHYKLFNGNSINLIGGRPFIAGVNITIVEDPTLAEDDFVIGDFSIVNAGIYTRPIYFETDGRTDADPSLRTGVSINVRTHVLETFVAIQIPNALKNAIVKDTFSNTIALISA